MKRKNPYGLWCQELRDLIFGVLGIIFFTVFVLNSLNLDFGIATTTVIGADFFPKVFCGLGILLSILLVVKNLVALTRKRKSAENNSEISCDVQDSGEEATNKSEKSELIKGYMRVAMCVLFMVMLIVLIKYFGFFIGAFVYCFAQLLFLSTPAQRKNWKFILKMIVLSVLVPGVLYVTFRFGLNIMLPTGVFM